MPELPPEEYPGLVAEARVMRQMFTSYVDAGFTEDQALRLVAAILVAKAEDSQQRNEQRGR